MLNIVNFLLKLFCFLLLPGIFGQGCAFMPVVRESRPLMGTVVEITVHHRNRSEAEQAVERSFREAERLERLFSAYREDSEVSEINRRAGKACVRVSEETFRLIQRAVGYSELSGGAFDITVAPLLEVWGFRNGKGRVPSAAEIESALLITGYEKIMLDPEVITVKLAFEGMQIDLGGIAKGYIVDSMAEILREAGLTGALVNAGGDIYALGTSYGGGGWRVGLRHPRERGRIIDVLDMKDNAVATSGDYERYFIEEGTRYSHIIDPRTGMPAAGVMSATVLAENCTEADALATMLYVLGEEEGAGIIRELGAEAVMFEEGWEHGEEKRI